MSKNIIIAALLVLLGAGGAYVYVVSTRPPAGPEAGSAAGVCVEHGVPEADCPWCNPALVETKGICAAHDVPEALCWKCNSALIAGFKAENDWCAGHGVPESQCDLCKAGDLPPGEEKPSESRSTPGGDR